MQHPCDWGKELSWFTAALIGSLVCGGALLIIPSTQGAYHNHTGNNLPVARCYFTHGCGLWWEKYVTVSINNYERWDSLPVLEVGWNDFIKPGDCGRGDVVTASFCRLTIAPWLCSVSTSRCPARMWASRLSTDALVFYAFPIWWVFIRWSEWYSSPYWQWQLWRLCWCILADSLFKNGNKEGDIWWKAMGTWKKEIERMTGKCNSHKKMKRWQDKNREMYRRKEKVWMETGEEMGE